MTLLNELLFREIDIPDLIPDVIPKGWIDKKVWREINDILRLNRFCWLNNGKEKGCWIRLKQRSLMEYF